MIDFSSDVLVVGSGNAAFCAALAAQQRGRSVRMLEVATEAEFGGNSRYTAGAMRFAYQGGEQLLPLLADPDDPRLLNTDFGCYPEAQFLDDLRGFNGAQPITPQQQQLVDQSLNLIQWLHQLGVSFSPIYSRQSFEKNGRFQFWGGLTLCADGEGEGLVQRERELFLAAGGLLHYKTEAIELVHKDGVVSGVKARQGDAYRQFAANAVGACLWRFRGQQRVTTTAHRSRLAPRQGSRQPPQSRPWYNHGYCYWRSNGRQIQRLPRDAYGSSHAELRQSGHPAPGTEKLQKNQLPVWRHDQRARRPLCR